MNCYDKRGVTPVSVLMILVILVILAGMVTVSTNYIMKETYKKEFIREYALVKSAVEDYIIRNSGVVNFEETQIDTSTIAPASFEQFSSETIVDDMIDMYVIDLEKIGVYETTYGLGEGDDVYVLSKNTNEVYYKKGFNSNGTIYYKAID